MKLHCNTLFELFAEDHDNDMGCSLYDNYKSEDDAVAEATALHADYLSAQSSGYDDMELADFGVAPSEYRGLRAYTVDKTGGEVLIAEFFTDRTEPNL